MALDDAQREAIEAPGGALLIAAPPGSGKTHTLAERICRLISRENAAPERILALTFTNKAAGEMRERIGRRVSGSAPCCATFHALALQMLRAHGSLIGIAPDFAVVEDEKTKPGNSLSFEELLSQALRLLEQSAEARLDWQRRFDHILVDEYQDIDPRQDAMAAILASGHGSICAIGDPDQAIYGFRGARAENFSAFAARYPAARTVRLRTNYRSTRLLVEAADALIGADGEGATSLARTAAARSEAGEKIALKECASPSGEARWIVSQIEKLIGGTYHESGAREARCEPGDIAVLYRFNALGHEFAKALGAAGIPCVSVTEQTLDEIEFETFRVALMTMHAAKGLEFPVVFMAGLEDGVIPHFGFDDANERERSAEERRLFYVAMTRAKDRLFLSHSRKRNLFGKTFSRASRFIREIPREYIAIEEPEKPGAFQKRLF